MQKKKLIGSKNPASMAGNISSTAVPLTSSLSKLQSLNGIFAIYKKRGPTSADVLNKLKETLLKGNTTGGIRKSVCSV